MVELNGKKILVTGGTGHLGSAIVHHLVNGLHIPPSGIRIFYLKDSPVNSLNDITGLDMFAGNILDKQDVFNAFTDVQLVFHTVGSTTFDPRQKKIQWLVNVEGTRNVLEAAKQSPSFQKMVYTSTVNVLGIPDPVGSIGNFESSNPYINSPKIHSFNSAQDVLAFIDEAQQNKTDWAGKINVGYYDSKLAAQELVNYYTQQHKLNITSILPGTMFGPYDYLVGNGMYLLALYQNKMPVVLGGGLPLAHVMDVAEGQVLAMQKAGPGSRYILAGREEDNRYLKDMCSIIVDVLRKEFPEKKFKAPSIVIPKGVAMVAAFFSEHYSKLFNKPMLLSRDAVRPGTLPSFYSSINATTDFGYSPQRTFRQGVEDMLAYYKAHNILQRTGRWIDERP